jgi:hypothetical protein
MTANRSMPSASATLVTSAAADATSRPGWVVDPLHIPRRHECMISIARDTTRNVTWWRDGKMIKRWCAGGMLDAEPSVGRRKGYRQTPRFVAALARHLQAVPPACDAARVA